MPTNVIMPQMGESIFEGTLTKWLKKPGDQVQRDEPLFEISTDKVDAEIPSPAAGVLSRVLVHEGQTVQINTVVAEIDEAGGTAAGGTAAGGTAAAEPAPAPQGKAAAPAPPPPAPAAAGKAPIPEQAQPLPGAEEPPAKSAAEFPAPGEGRTAEEKAEEEREEAGGRTSPLVRRLAAEHNIDLGQVKGTGLGGRITKNDILAVMEGRGAAPAAPPRPAAGAKPPAQPRAAAPTAQPSPAAPQPATPSGAAAGRVEVVPMSVMRQKIAQHMVESKRTSAHVHTVFQVDMSRVARLRGQHQAEFEQRNGIKLTYMPFITRAAVIALQAYPWVNASIDGNNIVLKRDINIGIAVALEWGLIVPVVRNAEEKNFWGLARAIRDLADRARAKKLSPDEVQGGTFTITNPGSFGALFGTPVISQPQVAILGIGSIHKAPVVVDDAIAIRSIVHLSLGFDHRLIDGALADQFMAHLKNTLENWEEPIL